MEMSLLVAATLLVGFNVFVSALIWRSSLFTRPQKISQSFVIWLIPIIGGVLTWSVLRSAQPGRFTIDLADRQGSSGGPGDVRLDSDAADIGGFGHNGGGH